jgi:hypothetical protein
MLHPQSGPGILERRDVQVAQDEMAALWQKADEGSTRGYQFCGRVLRLRCDSPEYARRFEETFRRLRFEGEPASSRSADVEITFLTRSAGPQGFPALIDRHNGRVRVFDHEEVLPSQLFFCLAFIEEHMSPLLDHFVFHGSVVEHGGRVTALVGLTNSGKSTLGLCLALEPDIAFLSDEYCPVRLDNGWVEPFPRSIGLRQHARDFLMERGVLRESINMGPQMEADPLSIHGLSLSQGGSLFNIVLLSVRDLPDPRNDVRLLDLQFMTPDLMAEIRAIPGVLAVQVLDKPLGSCVTVRMETETGARVTEELLRLCRDTHRMEVCCLLSPAACRPDFAGPPILRAVKPMDGIMEVARHLVNFQVLRERFGGSYSRLLDCLAARLGGVRFFSLQPGPLEETSRLVRQKVLQA